MNQTEQSFAASLEEVRLGLVPEGYESFPFRKETPESFTDKLRSVVATYMFRKRVEDFKRQGLDFSMYLYIPEEDGNDVHHHRSDHGHLLKRIATSTREGKHSTLDMERFDEALRDKSTGRSNDNFCTPS
jgi:hypothetical protein